jgi:hypothetical protein
VSICVAATFFSTVGFHKDSKEQFEKLSHNPRRGEKDYGGKERLLAEEFFSILLPFTLFNSQR